MFNQYAKLTMRKISIFAAFFAATTMFGCASSDQTAMDETTTMSETQVMAGETMEDAESVVVEADVVVPVATIPIATLSLTNPVELNKMFDKVDETENYNIMELAKMSPNLSTFAQLAEAAGIHESLKRDGKFTLLAPTNEAFSKLPKKDLEMLLMPDNRAQLMAVLQAHVLPSEVMSTQFSSNQRIDLGNNRYLPVSTSNNMIMVGGSTVVVPNVEASNGVIHVIDRVIIPSRDAKEDSMR